MLNLTRPRSLFATTALVLALAACGSDPAPEPTEQIVVDETGDAGKAPADQPEAAEETGGGDLVAEGKAAFAICAACHKVEKGVASPIGPNLHGVVGRKAASLEDFPRYSDALKASGITWSEAELDAFLANPTQKVSGTTMTAGGTADAEKRKAIIAYLKDNAS